VKLLFLTPFLGGVLVAAGPVMPCASLATRSFGEDVKIRSATAMVAKPNLPAHCEVRGVIWPEAQFAIKLPTEWNERFEMVGNGGTAGVISIGAVDGAIRRGFVSSSTDTGHDAAKEPLASFAYETPSNPNARRKFLDFAWLAVHETAVLSKEIINAYYGTAPKYSYWVGCSTGGRQAFQEAQRFPEDFDGIVAGAPGFYNTGNSMRRIWIGQTQTGDGAIPAEKLPLLTKAIYDRCDAIDGLKDGLIDDPRKCRFDVKLDVKRCTGADGADCFTSAQIAALAKIYGGPRDSKGEQVFPGEPVGSEPVWPDNLIAPDKTVLPRAESQMKMEMLDPPPGPSWSFKMFDFDKDPERLTRIAADLNARNTDLGPFKKRRGKLLQYSGWADQQVNPLPGIEYFETVTKQMGEAETREFYRLFMVPGMFHCNGGPGCGSADWLGAVMEWVEKGIAPDQIVGSHVEKGTATRTRPLCPYPQVARYNGTGSIDEADSFRCVAPN